MEILALRLARRSLYDVAGGRDGSTPNLTLESEAFLLWKPFGNAVDVTDESVGFLEHAQLSMVTAHAVD